MDRIKAAVRRRLPKYVMEIWRPEAETAYLYLRRRGEPVVPLPGPLFSEAFWTAYREAVGSPVAMQVGRDLAPPGSIRHGVVAYFASDAFDALAPATQDKRRRRLEKFADEHGPKPLGSLSTERLTILLAEETPFNARSWRTALSGFYEFAVHARLCKANPTKGVRLPKLPDYSGGFAAWEEEHVAAYFARWPLDTRQGLALALLLNTAGRRGDVRRLGWPNAKDGVLRFRAAKNGEPVAAPVLPELEEALAHVPLDRLLFLPSARGTPMSDTTWGDFFLKACRAAGLPPGLSAHGVRKAAAIRLLFAGCTEAEGLAILGDRDPSMWRLYTYAANRELLARQGYGKLLAARAEKAKA
jgi:integrase